ncbi:MAG: DMT family transporter [Marinoscillum sp.]
MKNQLPHFLQLGLAILVMCTSGVLGRYIQLPPPVTIWLRCVIGAVALFVFLRLMRIDMKIRTNSARKILLLSSILLGAHWVTYFYSLHLSNVAIGMLSLFTYPVITALLEPLILKTTLRKSSLALAVISFAGIALLVPELNFDNSYTLGIAIGIFSALCYSVRNILLKKQVSNTSGITLMFYQLLIISMLLWPAAFMYNISMAHIELNWKALLLLGLFTTATGHTLLVLSFKHFTISTVSILSALTPLFGTLLGYLFLDEVPTGKTLLGGSLIFVTVVAESILSVRRNR